MPGSQVISFLLGELVEESSDPYISLGDLGILLRGKTVLYEILGQTRE